MGNHWLITGATSGIGRELARLAATQGVRLSLCGRDKERMQTTLDLCHLDHKTSYSKTFCLSNTTAIQEFAKKAEQNFGPVDVLINCAGLNNVRAPGHEVALADIDWLMKINVYAPISFMQTVIPGMQGQKSGIILNVLSTVCLFSNPGISAYTASKAALDAYIKIMRKELQESGIKMLSVYPGGVDTQFRAQSKPQYLRAESVAQSIMAILNLPEEVQPHELVIRPQCENNF